MTSASPTIQNVVEAASLLSLGAAYLLTKGNMKMCELTYDRAPLLIRLGEGLQTTTVAFAPSAFGGTGEEVRKGIVFRITPEDYDAFVAFEQWCRDSLRETIPNVDELWSPSARKSDKWGYQLKAKINIRERGASGWAAKFYDEAKELCDAPKQWQGLHVSTILQVRSCYVQRNSIGLLIDVSHLQYREQSAEQPEECPF